MPLSFQVLASGSKGNSVLICSSKTRILLDAGLTGKELTRRLGKTPVQPDHLDAMIISHEHQDHVRGAGVMSRRLGLPVYLTQGTMENLSPQVGEIPQIQIFQSGVPFRIGDLVIQAFATSHDAGESSGFVVESDGMKLGVCTDLGIVTQLVKTRLQGCHALLVEANHDSDLLLKGPYPWELKQRIRSRHGHLSNDDTLDLIKGLYHEALHSIVFAHLSEVNNHPSVLSQGYHELLQCEEWHEVRFSIASQYEVMQEIVVE